MLARIPRARQPCHHRPLAFRGARFHHAGHSAVAWDRPANDVERRARLGDRRRATAARRVWRVEAFRRGARGRGRDRCGRSGRDRLDHRPERRRQDHAAQHHQRTVPAQQRQHPAGRARHHRRAALAHRRHGGRPHVPEHRAVQRHERARQHHARASRAHGLRPVRLGRVLGDGAEGGSRAPQPGRGPDRLPQAPATAPATDRRARLRPAQAGRTGARARARAEDRAARRADGRHEPGREGGHGALHPRRERGVGHDHDPDRARHGRGDGYFRPGRGARSGPQDRRRHAGRNPAQPRCDQSLSRDEAMRHDAVTATATTLPALMRRNAATIGTRPAVREKDRGIWRTFTWAQYYEEVSAFALGLAAHGFKRGDKLSVIGDNRPRLYWAQLAAQSLGGIAVPVFQDSIAAELAYVFAHAEVSVIVAEDQEQVDKVLSLKDQLPALQLLIYDDPRGMRHYDSPLLKSFEEIQAAGRTFAFGRAGYLEAEIDKGAPNDIALFAYTSGTTGKPKGVMLTHANLISAGETFLKVEDVRGDDNWLCYLPMAWVGDSLYSTTIILLVGFTCNCPENVETVQRDLRELGPSTFLAPPRIWENLLTAIQIRAADASPLKRRLFEFFRNLAERAELARHDGKPLSLATRLALALC